MNRFALLLALLPSLAMADDVTIRLAGIDKGTRYELVLGGDGSVVVKPIVVVVVGVTPAPTPTPTPTPTPIPNPTSVAGQVQALTAAAIAAGGDRDTAVTLAGIYGLVAGQVDVGTIKPNQIGPALQYVTDAAVPKTEAEHWKAWRKGIGDLLATRVGTKADAVTALRAIESGLKAAMESSLLATNEAINWEKVLALILPILLALLQRFMNPM